MSGPDSAPASALPGGLALGSRPADVVELAALRERAHVLRALATRRGLSLPAFGRLTHAGETLLLCVRPERWLILTPPAAPGAAAAAWQEACSGIAAAVELSSALVGLTLRGAQAREALARGCRLDLDAAVFPAGHAAATLIAQVPVLLAALPGELLLLTPATTARHFREWLAATARPFGLTADGNASVAAMSAERVT